MTSSARSGGWRTWRAAMSDALYGPRGFYRAPGTPARHFRTSGHASPLFADAVGRLATRFGLDTVYDVGAGGGELLAALAGLARVGVDVAPRPPSLPDDVRWSAELPPSLDGLVVANEWLDNVPVDVVEMTDAGPCLVEVDDTGNERLGPPPWPAGTTWLDRWWPLAGTGDRAEIGTPRDEAWADVLRRLRRGVAVAIDYAVDPRDPHAGMDPASHPVAPVAHPAGTLTGYRDGRQVQPVPDGSCDVTAHVLLASVAEAGRLAGADWTLVIPQRDALRWLGVSGRRPAYDLARSDPAAYLEKLAAASEAAELMQPGGLGDFTWLVQGKGVPPPAPIRLPRDAGVRASAS